MNYDFTTILDRKGNDALALDMVGYLPDIIPSPREGFEPIAMWVADMNFPVVPTIQDAIIQRVKEPHFGYFMPRDDYFSSIIQWQETRNGVTGLTKECIGYENGVIGGVISALNVMGSNRGNVLVHSPPYIGLTTGLSNNVYHIVHSPLTLDADNIWRMDFEDMEKKIVENKIHAAIFCSPHNPTGRVWERWEVEQFMDLCKKHDVYVISDEIWSDLTLDGYQHIPTQMISEDARQRTIGLYAPSKTFNLAGLVGSYHIIYNQWLRERVDKESSLPHYNDMNMLSMYALIGAYKPEGYEWLDELRQVLTGNVDYACGYIAQHFKGIKVSRPQGTYMLFLDCTDWCASHGKTMDELLKMGYDVGVVWQDGRQFHGPCHIRMNLASPLSRIQEAFHRLDKYVFNA